MNPELLLQLAVQRLPSHFLANCIC